MAIHRSHTQDGDRSKVFLREYEKYESRIVDSSRTRTDCRPRCLLTSRYFPLVVITHNNSCDPFARSLGIYEFRTGWKIRREAPNSDEGERNKPTERSVGRTRDKNDHVFRYLLYSYKGRVIDSYYLQSAQVVMCICNMCVYMFGKKKTREENERRKRNIECDPPKKSRCDRRSMTVVVDRPTG